MKKPWKIHAFSRLITELAEEEDMFICTYKDYAEPFTGELEKVMSPEQLRHVLLMTNRGHLTLPYLGGTNGSNDFHAATQVFMLGYPRLNPRDYLIRTCAAYGPEQLVQEFASVPLETLASPNLDLSSLLPSMQQYIAHHLAARLEQEIYRCALRNPGFTGCIKVFLFCPPPNALHILLDRIPGTVIQYDDLPSCVELSKATARQYDNGNTSFARLALFLKGWDGAAISPTSIQTQLGISKSVWKDLMRDSRVRKMFEQYGVERSGKGPNTKLHIANRACA